MKFVAATTFILLLSLCAISQNAVPVVSNITVSINEPAKSITVNYDLHDNESDQVEIIVTLSGNWGETFLLEVINPQGDVGFPVAPGTNKQMTFNYNDTLQPDAKWMVKVAADDRQPIDIQEIVDQVDTASLRNYLTFITGIRHYQANPAHLEAVKDYIENNFRQSSLLAYRQDFVHNNYNAANIISWLAGLKNEKKTYIVDAHFDSVNNSPGADDNGSGIAGVLEAARILSQYRFEHTIKFIGFDFEETSSPTGGLTGSINYVANGIKPHEEIDGVFNFEMIGYYSEQPNSQQVPPGFSFLFPDEFAALQADNFRGNFIVNTAIPIADSLKMAFDEAAAQYVPALKVTSVTIPGSITVAPDFWRSDHASFWFAGIKALMLTDGANFRNHNYHTPNDVLGTINFEFMSNVVKATIAAVATLAKPVHGSAGVAYLFDTAVKENSAGCDWRYAQSAQSIQFFHDASCAVQNWSLCLYDMQGRLVFHSKSFQDEKLTLETSRFARGQYLFVAESGGGKSSLSIVVK